MLKKITTNYKLTRGFSYRIMHSVHNSPYSSPLKDSPPKIPTDRPFRVSIEGNIGAGKSTLINYFEKLKGIETYSEPIDLWRNANGHNLLELMYSNIQEWLKVFQSYVQLTRLQIQTSKPKSPDTTVQIFERSLQNNRFCFVELAHQSGFLSGPDYALLDKWYSWIESNVNIELDLIVYLRSSPDVVFERMKARGRPEENSVSFEYLKDLHNSHEQWLMSGDGTFQNIPVLVLDADVTLDEIHEQLTRNERRILGFERRRVPTIDQNQIETTKRKLEVKF